MIRARIRHAADLFVAILLLLCWPLAAQTVRVRNHADQPFAGWIRTMVDVEPAASAGAWPDGTRYVVVGRWGAAQWAVDLRIALPAAGDRSLEFGSAAAGAFTLPVPPADLSDRLGGQPTLDGQAMLLVEPPRPDGAAWATHWRARTGRLLVVDLWTRWYPDEPWAARGEVLLTASNPTIPDLETTVAADQTRLRWGSALMLTPGRFGTRLMPAGTRICDGQSRAWPMLFVWPAGMPESTWTTVLAIAQLQVGARGVSAATPWGTTPLPASFRAIPWIRPMGPAIVESLYGWQWPPIAPNPTSGNTGAQADQYTGRGAELFAPDGVGVEQLLYMAALGSWPKRWCHLLELNGEQVDRAGVMIWNGRAHADASPDKLGKDGYPQDVPGDAVGPDNEHALFQRLFAVAHTIPSEAIQHELRQVALLYLMGWTVESERPGWATNNWWASRAVGYELRNAAMLHWLLRDRAIAGRVANRARKRWAETIRPDWWAAPNDIVDVRVDDPRLGDGAWWMPWQQSVAADGLDVFGQYFAVPDARQLAVRLAKRVIDTAYYQTPAGAWRTYSACALDGRAEPDNIFWGFGMPLAPAVVLRNEPTNARARAIWQVYTSSATSYDSRAWWAQGVPD